MDTINIMARVRFLRTIWAFHSQYLRGSIVIYRKKLLENVLVAQKVRAQQEVSKLPFLTKACALFVRN